MITSRSGPDRTLRAVFRGQLLPRLSLVEGSTTPGHYEWAISKYDAYLQQPAQLDDLQDDAVWACLQSLLASGLAPYTVSQVRDKLLSLWRFCNRKGLVPIGPDVPRIRLPEAIPLAFTLDELRRLFGSSALETGHVYPGVLAADWWPALFHAIFDSGERISAVLSWQWDWLGAATGDVFCPANARKGQKQPKTYRLRQVALEAVLRLESDSPLIFPWAMHRATFYDHLKRIKKRADLPMGREWCCHAIRKSHASYLELHGGDAQRSLGHSSRAVTERYLSPRILTNDRHSSKLPEV